MSITKKVITIDTDGVLRNFADKADEIITNIYKIKSSDFSNKYSLEQIYNLPKEVLNKIIYEEHCKEIFLNALPYENAITFVKKLSEYCKVILASSQPYFDAVKYTLLWYEKYTLINYDIIFTEDKSRILTDILIEDSPTQIIKALYSSKESNNPKKVICRTQLWNLNIDSILKENNFDDISLNNFYKISNLNPEEIVQICNSF